MFYTGVGYGRCCNMLRHQGKAGGRLSLNIGPVLGKLRVDLGSIIRYVAGRTIGFVASISSGFGGRSKKSNHFVETL